MCASVAACSLLSSLTGRVSGGVAWCGSSLDTDVKQVSKEATFLIACATEQLLGRLTEVAARFMRGKKRRTVTQTDVVRTAAPGELDLIASQSPRTANQRCAVDMVVVCDSSGERGSRRQPHVLLGGAPAYA
jgi:hypothetical protein